MRVRAASQLIIYAVLLVLLALTFVPVALMLLLSLKSNADVFSNFWGMPSAFRWWYYSKAFDAVHCYLLNSIIVCVGATAGILVLSSLSGYVFARHDFPLKNQLFLLIIALMMVPGILTLIPNFLLVKNLGLLNTRWALILPYMAGGQVFGIMLCRSFIAETPKDLFEAARLDGATELQVYRHIVIPITLPILATIGIMNFFGIYNDYIWPLIVISDNSKQVFTVALTIYAAEYKLDMGPAVAGYVIGCVPLLLLIAFGMKYFVKGVTSGAIKA